MWKGFGWRGGVGVEGGGFSSVERVWVEGWCGVGWVGVEDGGVSSVEGAGVEEWG